MCRNTVQAPDNSAEVLAAIQRHLHGAGGPPEVVGRGSGPRLFCGHVPPEATEELVKAHFSQWGTVIDVYFPKNKHTFRRRPFCFVTFATLDAAQRALAESPMNICGIPIKQLTMVEDRMDYYKHRNIAAQNALVQALQTLALVGPSGAPVPSTAPGAGGAVTPPLVAPAGAQLDLHNLAALLALEGAGANLRAPPTAQTQAYQPLGPQPALYQPPARYSAGANTFPGMLSPSDMAAATSALRLSAGAAFASPAYLPKPAASVGMQPPPVGMQLPPLGGDLGIGCSWGAPTAPRAATPGAALSVGSTAASYSLPSLPGSASTALSSPASGSPPNSLSGMLQAGAFRASLRAEAQQASDVTWGLAGGAFPN